MQLIFCTFFIRNQPFQGYYFMELGVATTIGKERTIALNLYLAEYCFLIFTIYKTDLNKPETY